MEKKVFENITILNTCLIIVILLITRARVRRCEVRLNMLESAIAVIGPIWEEWKQQVKK